MKITAINGYHLALPQAPTTLCRGVEDYSGHLYRDISEKDACKPSPIMTYLVEVQTDAGITGYGEVASPNGARGALRMAGENLIGRDPLEIQHNMQELLGGTAAKNPRLPLVREHMALEFAMWDIAGKNAGLPVYNLLGGRVREKQAISLIVGQKPIDACLSEIDGAIKAGIRTIKVQAGANDQRDVELLRQIREQFGWELILRVDAGRAWGDVTDAVRILKQMSPYNLQYIEDGLNRADGNSYRRLREMTGIPICMSDSFNGNGVMNAHDALTKLADLIRSDAVDVLGVNPTQTGGILGFTQVAAFCEAAGVEVVLHHALAGLSQSIWLTAASTCYSCDYAQDILSAGQTGNSADDILVVPLTHKGGFMCPPAGAGFGVEINWDNVRKYCLTTECTG